MNVKDLRALSNRLTVNRGNADYDYTPDINTLLNVINEITNLDIVFNNQAVVTRLKKTIRRAKIAKVALTTVKV